MSGGIDPVSALIMGGGQLFSSIFGSNAQAEAARLQNQQNRYATDKNFELALKQMGMLQEARTQGASLGNQGEAQFLNSTANAPQELQNYIDAFTKNTLPQQQQAMNQFRSTLNQNNVRGSRASTLANRQYGEYNNQLNQNIQNTAFQNAMDRQNQRSQYFSNKGLTGFSGTMK